MHYNVILNKTKTNYTVGGSAATKNTVIATFYGKKPNDYIVNNIWAEIRDELIDNAPEVITYFEDGKDGCFIRFEYDNSYAIEYYSLRVIEVEDNEEEDEW